MCGLPNVSLALVRWRIGVCETTHKELAGAGNVGGHIRMHGVLGQEVDAKFLTSLGEAHKAVERNDVGKDAAAFIEMNHAQELKGSFLGARLKRAPLCGIVEVIDAIVLFVQDFV